MDAQAKIKIIAMATIILKRVGESRCDVVFNNIQFDITRLVILVENGDG